jgi:hypothetical protein
MSTFSFAAACVAVGHPDDECHLVGFADAKFDTRHYLLLQRAFEHDAQDVELGMDTYHVEWCSTEQSGYGGIARFVLHGARAEIEFEADVAAELEGLDRLVIDFSLPPAEFAALRQALGHVFAGSDGVFEVAT